MTGYINLSDFLLDRLKSLSNTRISLDLFEDAVLKSNYCSQEEFNKSMKFLLDSDKIEYKVDKNGIYVEIKNRGHSPWVNIPVGRSEYPDSYNPGDTDPCIVPSENSIPYATNDSGGWSTISNIRWYAGGSVGCDWNLTDGQPIVGSESQYNFILNVPVMSIEVPENSRTSISMGIRSFEYTKTDHSPIINSVTMSYPITYSESYDVTISGSFKVTIPWDNLETIGFLINRIEGSNRFPPFLIKFESEQYKCQLESVEYYGHHVNHQREYKFRFSGSRIQ